VGWVGETTDSDGTHPHRRGATQCSRDRVLISRYLNSNTSECFVTHTSKIDEVQVPGVQREEHRGKRRGRQSGRRTKVVLHAPR
jgi:hypothetical protein